MRRLVPPGQTKPVQETIVIKLQNSFTSVQEIRIEKKKWSSYFITTLELPKHINGPYASLMTYKVMKKAMKTYEPQHFKQYVQAICRIRSCTEHGMNENGRFGQFA